MKLRAKQPTVRRAGDCPPYQRGLSLIEMMVAVTLLTVIIIGLVAMFEQTRKAFTAGLANVDYQDSGRVAVDLIARDLQQMAPANPGIFYANSANTFSGINSFNFFTANDPPVPPMYSLLVTLNGDPITNTFQRLFFTTQYNQTWHAVGYWVNTSGQPAGVGTLYQYRASGPVSAGSGLPLTNDFSNFAADTNAFSPVIDGVVNFRVRAYDPNGNLITSSASNLIAAPLIATGDYSYAFSGSVVPAYVEIELTVLENKTLDRYRSMGSQNAQTYFTNHVGQMHVFKQRVSIASLDRTAYP